MRFLRYSIQNSFRKPSFYSIFFLKTMLTIPNNRQSQITSFYAQRDELSLFIHKLIFCIHYQMIELERFCTEYKVSFPFLYKKPLFLNIFSQQVVRKRLLKRRFGLKCIFDIPYIYYYYYNCNLMISFHTLRGVGNRQTCRVVT